eukprot:Nitzschia sp. Nitz4//scaffold105_size73764//20664//21416//NITZ4_005673-RA/size73764-processed-gene-0.4-mRNA-1//1//CDS//3329532438//6657//frame0
MTMLPVNRLDSSSLETLANATVLNNQASQDMLLQNYDAAATNLVEALEKLKTFVVQAMHTVSVSNTSVSIRVAWETLVPAPNGDDSMDPAVFQRPLVLIPSACKQSDAYETFVRPVSFAVIINFGICRHMQALREFRIQNDEAAKEALGKAIHLYLQAGQVSRLFHQRRTHFELIVLNNLGHAYQLMQYSLQTLLCFQCLSIAAEDYRRTEDLYTQSPNIQALIDGFIARSDVNTTTSRIPDPPSGAPVA